jgi:DinB superfamily
MNPTELFSDSLTRTLGMLTATIADFSDADMFVRPCPGANHTAWQLGHLISSETRMVNGVTPGAAAELPAGWDTRFTKETCGIDDPAQFPNKKALLDQLAKTRAGSVAWVKTLTPADMDRPAPERMAKMAPTLGHLIGLMQGHAMMHMGQMQVIRRKLGKPILF